MTTKLRRWWCALTTGHAWELMIVPGRIYARCPQCQLETPGWRLDLPTPVLLRARVIRFRKRLSA